MKTSEEILKESYPELYDDKGIFPTSFKMYVDAMEEYANQSKWISVKDKIKPEDGMNCNCLMKSGEVVTSTYDKERNQFERYKNNVTGDRLLNYHYDNVTHWQPLPTAP